MKERKKRLNSVCECKTHVKGVQQAWITKPNFLRIPVLVFLEDLSAPKPFGTVRKEERLEKSMLRITGILSCF